jgi:hypothetical protein
LLAEGLIKRIGFTSCKNNRMAYSPCILILFGESSAELVLAKSWKHMSYDRTKSRKVVYSSLGALEQCL